MMSILNSHKLIFTLFSILCLVGCSEVIELKNNSEGGQVVIYGRISNSTQANEVIISRSGGATTAPLPIEGAIVKIIDNAGAEELLVEEAPGRHVLIGDIISGEFGQSYRLEVTVNNKLYTTQFQELMPVIAQDEMRYEIGVERDITSTGTEVSEEVVSIFFDSDLPAELPDEFFIRWEVEEAYSVLTSFLPIFWFPRAPSQKSCIIVNKLGADNIFLLDGREIRTSELRNRKLITRRIDRSFSNKHYFNLIQSSVSQENHEYWQDLRTLTITNGSIFDPVVGPLKGNIQSSDPEEDVFGFFEVIGIDTTRLLMTNNDIPVFFEDPCQLIGEKIIPLLTVPFGCVDCLIQRKLIDPGCLFCSENPGNSPRPSYF